MIEKNDWRLTNQESYLIGKKLALKKFTSTKTDHEHCEFCWEKIMENNKDAHNEAYTTDDEYHWVCKTCYFDFKEMFKWK